MTSRFTGTYTEKTPDKQKFELPETRKIKTYTSNEQRLIYDVHQHRFQLCRENRELKKTQAYLESSGSRYFSLYLNAPVAYFTFSPQGQIFDANFAAAGLFQVDRHLLVGRNINSFCVPGYEKAVQDHIHDAFSRRVPQTCETKMASGSGRHMFLHVESIAQLIDGVWEVQSTMLDISERINIEQALRQSERKYREIIETTQEGVWIFDSKLRISYANPRLSAMLGYSVNELVGKHLFEFIDSNERQFLEANRTDRRHRGVREKRLLKKDKTYLWVLESLNPLLHEDGYCLGRLGMLTDISQQKKVEQALKLAQKKLEQKYSIQSTDLRTAEMSLQEQKAYRVKAEAELSRRQQALEAVYAIAIGFRGTSRMMFERIVTNVSDVLGVSYCGIGICDGSHFSLSVQRSSGRTRTDASIPIFSVYCGIVIKEAQTTNLKHGTSHWDDIELLKSSPYQSFLGIPITDSSEKVLGAICILDTECKCFDKNDIQFMEIFARYIANHILQEQMQNQLLHSREMRMLGQLTSGVAHEVRNPLNAIVAITEALFQDIGENEQYAPYLEHVRLQVNRLSALMQDLLDLGKPERQFDLRKMNVHEIIETSVEAWRQSSPHRNRLISVVMPDNIQSCCVNADPLKIQQIFSNLIDNACHHSDESTGIVIAVMPPRDGKVGIKVIDRGCGIRPEQLARLFEPFYTTRKGGTGLGLSVVRHIVSVHGGMLTVSNNDPAPGLTMEISLPVVQA